MKCIYCGSELLWQRDDEVVKMNKEKLIINYCNNTALEGFDIESEENSGEQWI